MLKGFFGKKRDQDKPVKIILSTDNFRILKEESALIKACDQYDPTFSSRYFQAAPWDPAEKRLNGESFWDVDKFSIFYLDIAGEKIGAFVEAMKQHDICQFIAEIDGDYNLKTSQKPLYIDPERVIYGDGDMSPYLKRRDRGYALCIPESANASQQDSPAQVPKLP